MRTLGKIAAMLGVVGAIAVGSVPPAAAYYYHRHYHPYYHHHHYHPYYHHRYYRY